MEMYYVDDKYEKNRANNHIVVIALNNNGRKHLNRISSLANTDGFYYRPRVDLKDILSLPPKDIVVTTACINNRIYRSEKDDGIESFLLPLKNHFKEHFFLEVQNHNHPAQIEWNKKVLELSSRYSIDIIHGNDTHYIYPEDSIGRAEFIAGKGMNYGEEDVFILDYPDSDTIIERYKLQGVLNEKQILKSIKNTSVFEKAEDLGLTKDIKMPTIYPELTPDQRFNKLCMVVHEKWQKEKDNIPKERHREYLDAIKFELNIIKDTNSVKTADYFLFNEKMIDRGVNVYGGTLSRTGRGSAVGFYVNKLLGFTEVDRLQSEVPLYPTRFMSKSRILETRSMADIDFNTADPEPFIKASTDLLGEDNVYYMLAYGTMQESEAFRNLCRARNMKVEEYNSVAKDLDAYREDPKWSRLIKDSEKFIDVIDSVSPSPCSFLLLNDPISEEIGITKVGDIMCASIDGGTADKWKFLKNDILTVTVWDIIAKVYKRVGKPIPNIEELKSELNDDVWNIYRDKITVTLNQVNSEWATGIVGKYKPRTVAELTAFVAAIRPSFASLLNNFLEREGYTTGTPELDELLESSFHYLLYQENIMQYLTWLSIEEDQTYGLIKRISKKSLGETELEDLEKILHQNWIKVIGDDEKFLETWQVIQNSARYGFNASHAHCVALDSLYGANAKAKYPLEYYAEVLNIYQSNTKMTARILSELDYFNIKLENIEYGKSNAEYTVDHDARTIYKGMESIKFMNKEVSNNLYEYANTTYSQDKTFIEILEDISENKLAGARHIKILIGLNFFRKFGANKKLMNFYELYDDLSDRKQISIAKIEDLKIDETLLKKYSGRQTPKTYVELDMKGYLSEVFNNMPDKPFSAKEQIAFDMEYLEYTTYTNEKATPNLYAVVGFKTFKDRAKPYVTLRQLQTGIELKSKVTRRKQFLESPFELNDIIRITEFKEQYKMKKVDDDWISSDEKEKIMMEWRTF